MKFIIYNIIFVCFFVGISDKNYDTLFLELEKKIEAYKNRVALKKIDSVLVSDYKSLTTKQTLYFKTLKVEALTRANLFQESLKLSKELLNNKDISKKNTVRILINNALAYEYIGNFIPAKEKLDEIAKIYADSTFKRDELYGRFLYRTSSFYRVQGKYDSLAIEYAKKSKTFAIANNYKSEAAVASMLLGFLSKKNTKKAKNQYNDAIYFFKKVNDFHGISSMYMAFSRIESSKKNYNRALVYCDSALWVETPSKRFGNIAYIFERKAKIYETIGKLDSSLINFKKHQHYKERDNLNSQEIKVNELQFGYAIEKEKLKTQKIKDDLKDEKKRGNRLLFSTLSLLLFSGALIYSIFKIKKQNSQINKQKLALDNSVTQKDILLKELHHRVKNNLSMILSLIKLQNNKLKNSEDKEQLKNLEKRIETIAITHNQFLYKENKKQYSLKDYIDKIIYKLINLSPKNITVNALVEDIKISIDTALPIGIITNELITNSLKHAVFEEELVLTINLKLLKNQILLTYFDNGKSANTSISKDNLGLFLIDNMVKQLSGTYQKNKFKYNFTLFLKNE